MSLFKHLRHVALSSLVALGAVATGVAPQLNETAMTLSWEGQAIAQTYSSSELRNYAEAYLAIYGGTRMQDLLMEVETLTGKKTSWEISCDNPTSINNLRNNEAIAMVRTYCNEELPSLLDNIIPRSTFNEISNQLETDEALQTTIFDLMTEILNGR